MRFHTPARWAPTSSLSALAIGALLAGCASNSSSPEAATTDVTVDSQNAPTVVPPRVDTSGIFYSNPKLGLTITEFEEWGNPEGGEFKKRDDGTFELYGEARVAVEGVGERYVTAAVYAEPADTGRRVTVFTVDSETEQERHFHYDPSEAVLVLGDEEGGVFVFKEPDGTYGVVTSLFSEPPDDATIEIVNSGYEAWQVLQKYNQYGDTSNYSLLMAYALAVADPHPTLVGLPGCTAPCCPTLGDKEEEGCCTQWTPLLPFTQQNLPCEGCPSVALGVCTPREKGDLAQAPPQGAPVCEVFKELCDCIACQAAGRGDSCELCNAPQQ